MFNPDMKNEKKNEIMNSLQAALSGSDETKKSEALLAFAVNVREDIMNEYRGMTTEMLNDRTVLAARGVYQLTNDESKYYNAVIEGQGFVGIEQLVPPTVINRVFEYLTQNHTLLKHINFVNTTGTTQWVLKKGDVNSAWWGKLCAEIKEMLDEGFETIQMNLFKLSGFIPICKSMLVLGPEWLDRYVRTIIAEAMAISLEDAIIAGTGVEMPVGMIKDMTTFNQTTGYPNKSAVSLADLSPQTLGNVVMSPLTKDGKRAVSNVLMLVNPLDFWEKIFSATTMLTMSGTYVHGILPIPATIVQSVAVPKGTLIAGIGSDYFMGVGSNQKIEYSDEYHFLEDERIYLTKMLANGRPKDNDSFLVFDISTMQTGLNA